MLLVHIFSSNVKLRSKNFTFEIETIAGFVNKPYFTPRFSTKLSFSVYHINGYNFQIGICIIVRVLIIPS